VEVYILLVVVENHLEVDILEEVVEHKQEGTYLFDSHILVLVVVHEALHDVVPILLVVDKLHEVGKDLVEVDKHHEVGNLAQMDMVLVVEDIAQVEVDMVLVVEDRVLVEVDIDLVVDRVLVVENLVHILVVVDNLVPILVDLLLFLLFLDFQNLDF
jgi:hypothetical protein